LIGTNNAVGSTAPNYLGIVVFLSYFAPNNTLAPSIFKIASQCYKNYCVFKDNKGEIVKSLRLLA